MEMLTEFIDSAFFTYFLSVLVAALVGGIIGVEREFRDKSAGFRTMILISVGSCLFTIFSFIMGKPDGETTRVAAAVVSGVGFLGAGVILKDGITIRGLTTAASIWLVASLGVGAGIGEYELVGAVTVLVMLVLLLLPPIEHWLDALHDFPEFKITIKNSDKAEDEILDIFDEFGVKIVQVKRTRVEKGERIVHIKAKMNTATHEEIGAVLVSEKAVISVTEA